MIHLQNIVIVGVGGTGLSAIAGILHDLGYQNLIGINDRENQITQTLAAKGIQITIGHGQYEVQPDDFVIYADIPAIYDGPEVQQSLAYQSQETKHYHMPLTYNQFLAELSKHFRTLAITGTNGKSSTTALAITAGVAGSKQCALGIVGAMLPDHQQQNYIIGEGYEDYLREVMEHILRGQLMTSPIKQSVFVLESCEYKEHFLMYDTDVAITTNLTHDHHDYYPTKESYESAFAKRWKHTSTALVIPEEDKHLGQLVQQTAGEIPTIYASPASIDFAHVRGSFRSYNAGLAIAAREQIDPSFDTDAARHALRGFTGIWRRMEYLGETSTGTKIYSDYGHHPDAFERLIPEMREHFPDRELVVIFEPHQARRLLSLWEDFIPPLQQADHVWIYTPYTAREQWGELAEMMQLRAGTTEPDPDALGDRFAQAVDGQYLGSEEVLRQQLDTLTDDQVVLIMSAGILDQTIRTYLAESA